MIADCPHDRSVFDVERDTRLRVDASPWLAKAALESQVSGGTGPLIDRQLLTGSAFVVEFFSSDGSQEEQGCPHGCCQGASFDFQTKLEHSRAAVSLALGVS